MTPERLSHVRDITGASLERLVRVVAHMYLVETVEVPLKNREVRVDMHNLAEIVPGGAVLVRRDAIEAMLELFDAVRYGPRGEEPTEEQRANGIVTCVTAVHMTYLDRRTDAAEGHERHLRMALNGETTTGICAGCGRYSALTGVATSCGGR